MDILLVEDCEDIAEGLKFSLEASGYSMAVAGTIRKAEELFEKEEFLLVLLDVSMTDGNGFDFYKRWLVPARIPTIFVTAKDDENNIVHGLDLGAEDYITKPFSTRELIARINRVFLRIRKNTLLTSGDVTFNPEKMTVMKGGQPVALSALELKILRYLFINHDRAVSRNDIIELIRRATGNDVYEHTVTVYMKRIKDKLGSDIIKTVKGIGYRLDLGGSDE